MAGQQARGDAHPYQARCTNTTCPVRIGELLPLISTARETRQAIGHVQTPRHQDVDQPAKDRLATLHTAEQLDPFGVELQR